MKKLALMMVAGLTTSFAIAQKLSDKDVPQSVKSAFQKAYPNTKEVKWDKEGSNYEAEFDYNKTDYSVLFDAKGNLIETEVEIEVSQLPKSVTEFVSKHYTGQKIKEAAKITDAKGVVTYEAEIKGMDLLFDSKGNFIKELKN
ncbi:MAG: PepSY-like domain-containing protein [Chitinophagales bacterium]|nr:PepSY-like domain-containing protein [Chitinophagales bacterium]